MKEITTDILVIGAGPSGTVAASIAHKGGAKVTVIEAEKFPRFVIGESLIPSVMDQLDAAGFLPAVMKAGFQEKHGARFFRNGKKCQFWFAEQFTKSGWKWTWQLPRADFDKILADETEKMGIPIHYQTKVTHIEFSGTDSVSTVVNEKGEEWKIKAKFIIDSSGYGRLIPKMFDLEQPSDLPPLKAMFVHCDDQNRIPGDEGTLITFVVHRPKIWIWYIPFSNGNTSLGVVGDPAFFDEFQGTPEERFRAMIASEPQLGARYENAKYLWEPKTIEAYAKSSKKLYGEGFAITGNSSGFLDPVFSSGVAFATETGYRAALLAAKQVKGKSVDWENEYEKHIREGVRAFQSYVENWYNGTLQTVFFTDGSNETIKEQICSVLAGYVWDKTNPFVKRHDTAIPNLARMIESEDAARVK